MGDKAARFKWDWMGHVSRMPPDRWTTIATTWVNGIGTEKAIGGRSRFLSMGVVRAQDSWKFMGETFAL